MALRSCHELQIHFPPSSRFVVIIRSLQHKPRDGCRGTDSRDESAVRAIDARFIWLPAIVRNRFAYATMARDLLETLSIRTIEVVSTESTT